MADFFSEHLARFARIAVTGSPKAGKTTLCERVHDRPVIHTDDFIKLGWSEASAAVMLKVNETRGPLIVEGVAVPRALRKGMLVDCVIWLERMERWQHDTDKHERMKQGAWTVLGEWRQTSSIPVFIHGGAPLRNALPVQVYPASVAIEGGTRIDKTGQPFSGWVAGNWVDVPEPGDFDTDGKRRVR